MPSNYSASLRLTLQATGENNNTWGVILNTGVFQLVDTSIAGYLAKAVTGDTSLSSANGTTDEARNAFLKFTGAPSNNWTLTIPSVSKAYWIWNATPKTETVSTGAGTNATVDAGDIEPLWSDGANVKQITYGGLRLKDFIAASVLAATGTLPALTGNAGKFIYTDGVNALWRYISTTDLVDYQTKVLGVQVALAAAL